MTTAALRRYRRAFAPAMILLAWLLLACAPALAATDRASSAPLATTTGVSQSEEPKKVEGAEEHESWKPTIAKVVNFAALVAGLWYLLRKPAAAYLVGREGTIRRDLVDAATLRKSAEGQLADVRQKLAGLPAELDALRKRGQEELAAERVRMQEATAHEREKLLERTRRDIDLQYRLARRQLVEQTADTAMRLARARIEHTITPDDHSRLIDRYAAGVR